MSTHLQDRRTPEPDVPDDRPPAKEGLSITQVVGGALAAMTAAALGSRLGVAGTLVGAALASVVAAVAGSIYTSSLKHTTRRVSRVWSARGAETTADEEAGTQPARRSRISWKTVVAASLAAFAAAALTLTGLELATGRALSGGQGTTVGQVAEGGSTTRPDPSPSGRAPASPTPSGTASDMPGPPASSTPAPQPAPSATPEPTPSATPTPSGSASPTPSASGSAPVPGQ